MFVHKETGEPAWLLEQDGDVTFTTDPDSVLTRDNIEFLPAFDFFSTHREATPKEMDKAAPARARLGSERISLPMHRQPAAPKPAPIAAPKAAAKPKAKAKAKSAAKQPAASKEPAKEAPAEEVDKAKDAAKEGE